MPAVAKAYLESQVMTASPERLHLMIVDAAIRFARQAEEALSAAKFEAAFKFFSRSRACVSEILSGITSDPNPELANRLRGLFAFVQQLLTRAELSRDSQLVAQAVGVLEIHRETWLQLMGCLQAAQPDVSVADPESASTRSWTT
jgi:flagellar secretion chaperone FliS